MKKLEARWATNGVLLIGTVLLGALAAYYSASRANNAQAKNEVSIEEREGFRHVTSNGIPDHPTGQFPGRGTPHAISPQRHRFRMTLSPRAAEKITLVEQGKFGIALNGVPFDPGTAEWWNDDPNSGWHIVAHAGTNSLGLDYSNAHVQPNGAYHYHGLPYGWLNNLPDPEEPQIVLTGYAADGFPIYSLYGYSKANDPKSELKELRSSYRIKEGTRPGGAQGPGGRYDGTYNEDYEYVAGAGDLDECNGRTGVTPEYPNGTYYYVLTEEYPYVPRALRGTRDPSFRGPMGRPGGRGGAGPPHGGPPHGGPPDRPPHDGPPPPPF